MNLNIEKLISPISDAFPCGIDLRQDASTTSLYYRIKDARNFARDLERKKSMGDCWERNENLGWDKLLLLCIDAIENQSKDLEIATWMIEALVREAGFEGLVEGLKVLQGLIESYWGVLYPNFDEEGFESQFLILNSLNGENYEGTLIKPIHNLPITEGRTQGPFALWQYQQAIGNSKVFDKIIIDKRRSQGSVFLDQIYVALKETSSEFYQNLLSNLSEVKLSLKNLNAAVEKKSTSSLFVSSNILALLDVFKEHVTYLVQEANFKMDTFELKNKESLDISKKGESNKILAIDALSKSIIGSSITNRDEALMLIAKVADFFSQTEPQSPLPYFLKRSINLGRLSFPDLLKVLVNDQGARHLAYDFLGIEVGE